jgi:hypothetical protein
MARVLKTCHFQAAHCGDCSDDRVMCLDAGGGIWAVFPVLFSSRSFGFFLHSAITAFFVFNTIFNFVFAAFVPAGPPPSIEWGQVEKVNRGGLENYKFCSPCQKPKHPAAHHCRTCKACVMEMDHHCPFVCEQYLHTSCCFLKKKCLLMSIYSYMVLLQGYRTKGMV